jgi:hypothetical protein
MSSQSKQSCSAARASILLGRGLTSPQRAIRSITSKDLSATSTNARRKASTRALRVSLRPPASRFLPPNQRLPEGQFAPAEPHWLEVEPSVSSWVAHAIATIDVDCG